MELEKCHLLFGCEIMKFFSTGLLLIIVFGSLEGSTIPHKRTVRALNATIQTHFNGTIQRTNPCTNKEVERSSYRGCHEFHHHSKESNWSDYTRKCAALISDFFQAISNLVTFKDRQSGTFDLNINTKVSHKTDGACTDTKKTTCPTPAVIVETTDCEVPPSTSCDDLPRKGTHIKDSENCSSEEVFKVDEQKEEKCFVGSENSVNEEPQTAGSSSFLENDKCLDPSSGEKISESSDKKILELQSTQEINPPEIKSQSEELQTETVSSYVNYPTLGQSSETTNIESSASNTAPSTVVTSAPNDDLYIDVSETPQQPDGTDSTGQETSFNPKDYLSDYMSQTDEEKKEIQPSSAGSQPENFIDKVVPEDETQSIEFSDKIYHYDVHEPQHKSFQMFSPSTKHNSSDTTTPSTFEMKSDYENQDIPLNTQPTLSSQYQSESYDEKIQSSQTAQFPALQSEPENYLNQYDHITSDLTTSSSPKTEDLEYSDQLTVYNVRQPQTELRTFSSFLNEPTPVQPSASTESQPENYVNYEDGIPTSSLQQKEEEPSIEFSDQLAVYNVREPLPGTTTPYPLVPSSIQSSPLELDNGENYEDNVVAVQPSTYSSPSQGDEQYVEYSDQVAVDNIREPLPLSTPSPQQEEEPVLEFSDQLAVYNVREPLPGTTTPYPLVPSSIQSSPLELDNGENYEDNVVAVQPSTYSSPRQGDEQYVEYSDQVAVDNIREPLPLSTPSPQQEEEPVLEFSDQLAVYNVREPLPGTTTPYPLFASSVQPSNSKMDNYMNYEDEVVSQQPPTTPPQQEQEPVLEFSDQLAVYNVREPFPGTTTPYPLFAYSVQPSPSQPDNYDSYEDETVSNVIPTTPSPQQAQDQVLDVSDQLAVYNVREPLRGTTTPYPLLVSSVQPSNSQPDNYVSYEDETVSDVIPTTSSSQQQQDQVLEYSDQLAVYNVREPLPGTTTPYPLLVSSVQPSNSQPDNYVSYEDETVSNIIPTTSSPQQEEPVLELSDQLAVYNVREPLPGTTTPYSLVPSSIQSSPLELDNGENYEDNVVAVQPSTSSSPRQGDEQYVEYSDQVAVDNIREALPLSTSSPIVYENIQSSLGSTLLPSSSSYELDICDDPKTVVEPQPTFTSKFEEETYNFQEVTTQSQPSRELATEYYEANKEQMFSSEMSAFTTPAGNVYPTKMPSSEYIDNNGPESPSLDYSFSQDLGGFVSTSLPLSSDDASSFNNFELQYDPQPTSTLLPSEADQDQVFSDQVSDIREPQSDSSISDGHTSDMVTAISPTAESDSFISYDDGFSLTDSQQTMTSESQPKKLITNEYPKSVSSNQPLPNNYEIYDEQSSTSENEAPMTSTYEPTTYQQVPIDVITSSPSLTEPESFGIYDDSKYSVEPQGTYPPRTGNESFANYEDNDTSTAGQAYISIEPLSNSDSSEKESITNEEESSPPEEDGNIAISDDQGLLPLSPNTFRPTVQIETAVNYADQTPFRPIRLPSSIGPLQENNIIYDDGIFRNETEPSAVEGEEANNSLIVSSEHTKQNEGKELDSSTTLAPELEFDTYYEETFKQPASSDVPKTNTNEMNDYSTSFFLSTPSFFQEIITTPSTLEAMPETYTDYEYSKTDFVSQTFPPQTESVLYDDHSSHDQSLGQQQQSVDYLAYDDQIQSTSSPNPIEQEIIEFSDQLSIYNVSETDLKSSSPSLSELFSSNTDITTQPTIPSEGKNLELEPTFTPSVELQFNQPLPSKDLNLDTYINYEDTTSSSQLPTTPSPPNEVDPSLEYSDQLGVYNVRQPQAESPTSSSLLDEPKPVQSSASLESQPENYVNYEDGIASNQLPTSTSPPEKEEPVIEFSDQLAVYNIRQPHLQPTSTQPTSFEPQTDNYDGYEDETEPLSGTTTSYPLFASYVQPSLPQPVNYVSYEDETVSNVIPTTSTPQQDQEQVLEFSDQLAVYNVREPLPGTTTPYPLFASSIQPSNSQSDNYMNYEDEVVSQQPSTTPPQQEQEQVLEFSDQLAVYNIREPFPSTTTSSPTVNEDIQNSSGTTLPPLFSSNRIETYDNQAVENELQPTVAPEMYDEPTSASDTSFSPTETRQENYISYENGELPTSLSPPKSVEPFLEYSDQLSIYDARQPEYYSSSPSPVDENLVTSTTSNLSSNDFGTYNSRDEYTDSQPTLALESEPQMYDEPTIFPTSPYPPHEAELSLELASQTVSSSIAPSSSATEKAPFLQYSDQFSAYSVRQPYSEATPSSPFRSQDNYITYEDQTPSNALTTPPAEKVEPSLEYSDQLAIYNVRQPALESTAAPVISENILSSVVTTHSPSSLIELTSPQPSTSESQSDNYEDYEDEPSTTLSPLAQTEPPLEYSDQLAAFNVLGPVIVPISTPVIDENISSSNITASLTSSSLNDGSISPQSSSFELNLDSDEDYEDEAVSTPVPVIDDQPSIEFSDELSIYNVRQRPTLSSPSPLSEIIPISIPNTSSKPQDNYVSYEDETVLNVIPTTPPQQKQEQVLEFSDQLAVYNIRQPQSHLEPTSIRPTSPEPQPDNYDNYEDETEPNETTTSSSPPLKVEPAIEFSYQIPVYNIDTPTTAYTPSSASQPSAPLEPQPESYVNYEDGIPTSSLQQKKEEPSIEFSDQLAVYNAREPLPGSTTPHPLFASSVQPSPPQSDNYDSYEDETVSDIIPTTSFPQQQQDQVLEFSDQLAVYNVREPLPGTTTPYSLLASSVQPSPSQPDNYDSYEDETVSNVIPTTPSPQQAQDQVLDVSDQLAVYNVREPLRGTTTPYPLLASSVQPSPSQPDNYDSYEDETVSNVIPTTPSPQQAQDQVLDVSDQPAVYNVREPLRGTTTPYPLFATSVQPSSAQSENYMNYEDEVISQQPAIASSSPGEEQVLEVSDQFDVYNVREPVPETTTPYPLFASSIQPSPPQPDNYDSYEDETVSNVIPTNSSPQQEEPVIEFSDQLAVYNVREPLPGTTTLSPAIHEDIPNTIVTTFSPFSESDKLPIYDNELVESQSHSISASQYEEQYVNYEDDRTCTPLATSTSSTFQIEPSIEYSDQLAVYNVREPLVEPTSPPAVNDNVPSDAVTTLSPSSSNLQSESYSYEDYKDETASKEPLTTLSTPVQVEPSIEYSDQLAVYNIRESLVEPPVISENILSSVVTTLSPSPSLNMEPISIQPSSSESQPDSDEDYEDEKVSTPSPVTDDKPSLVLSDELSVYNVRQRPSEMSTAYPFNNNVISNLMTTISPYFTLKEPSLEDNQSIVSQTTVSPEYESDLLAEESPIEPSQSNEDDSQAISDETTSKDFLPETLSNFDEQTISNVIESTQSPDFSNQLYSKNEVKYHKVFTTAQPNIESSVISNSSFGSSTEQQFDYQPTLSPDYETHEIMTTPSSSRQSPGDYVVYEDQIVFNELSTSSPVTEVEPSFEYSNQLAANNSLLPRPSSPPQPQIVDYDYYNDQNQKSEDPSALPPTTEIDTKITLTEFGATFPPNFESQIFEKSNSIQHTSPKIQPDNYVDYDDSVGSHQMTPSPSAQTDRQPSIEFSDQLAVYNVRKPYFEPTSIQPSSSSSEPRPDNFDTYEDPVTVNELSTLSTPQKVEYAVTQITSAPERETQMYDEQTSSPATSFEPVPDNYVNYENEMISYEPTPSTATTKVEPSIEYSDQLAVYNVREPLVEPTSSPAVNDNVPSDAVTTLSPSSSNLQSDSFNYEDYKDETALKEPLTTLSTPVQVEPSIEYSDQLAVYNVREPLVEPTSPPAVSENTQNSVGTTISPSPSLNMEPISIQPSSSESQPDSDEDYEDEAVSTPSPVTDDEPSLELSDELTVYNVRQRPSEMSTAYPFNNNVISNLMTTISPFFTYSSNDNEGNTFQSSFTSEVEHKSNNDPISIQNSSSVSEPANYVSYEDEFISNEMPTTLAPPKEGQTQFAHEFPIYNVRQRSTESPPSSGSYVEPNSAQPSIDTESQPEYVSYETVSDVIPTTSSSQQQQDQVLEYSDQLAVYNVREPLPGTTTPYPLLASSVQPSPSQPDNYDSYEDETVSNVIPTTPSPQQAQDQVLEVSNKPAIYTVREPLPGTTTPYSLFASSVQPSNSQPDNYVSYEDETVSNIIPTTSSPQQEEPVLELSDQLAVYDVREPLPRTTTPYPLIPSSIQSSPLELDNGENYEDNVVAVQPSTSSPRQGDEQYVEYSDQLAVYNVRKPLPGTTTPYPLFASSIQPSPPQPDNYDSYEDETVSNVIPTTPSPQQAQDQVLEVSDQLAVYNVREPLPGTTTLSPAIHEDIPNTIVTTFSPFSESDKLPTYDNELVETKSHSTSAPQTEEQYIDYEDDRISTPLATSTSSTFQIEPSIEYSDQLAVYNVREPLVEPTSSPAVNDNVPSDAVTTLSPSSSNLQSDSFNYEDYKDETASKEPLTTLSTPVQVEPSIEYSDQLAVYNVREPLVEPTSSPAVNDNVPSDAVTTLSPSSSNLQSDSFNYEDYKDETALKEPLTTLSTPVQVEPSIEYSDQLAVYNVREPLVEPTSPPAVNDNVPSDAVTTLSPSSSNLQSESYSYEDYKDETASKEPVTTLSTPVQVEPLLEFSDQLAVYTGHQPEYLTSPSSQPELFANDLVTPPTSSFASDGFESSDNQVVYTDLQPTSLPESDSQMYDEPTSSPVSFSESQTNNYVNNGNKIVANVEMTSAFPLVDVDVEYSDEVAIYNVRQPSTIPPSLSGIGITSPPPMPDYYLNEMSTSGPLLDSEKSYVFTDQFSAFRAPESESQVKASSVPTTLPPSSQNSAESEQNDFYPDYDGSQSSDTQTTISPETEIEYDEAPTTLEPQSPPLSTQPLLETMVTTFQPLTESQINKTETKYSAPSKQQEVSTFPPLPSFIPFNQPPYSLPGDSKLVSEQQGQVISNQVVNSPLVPSSELDSDKQSNSNLVKSQETLPIDGVKHTQRDTPQPEPFALVPDQTNPSNEPDRMVIRDKL